MLEWPYFMKPNLHQLLLIVYFWWHILWWYVLWLFQNRMALKYPFPEVNIVLCSWPCLLTLLLPLEFTSKEILGWCHDIMTLYLSCCWIDNALLDFLEYFRPYQNIQTLLSLLKVEIPSGFARCRWCLDLIIVSQARKSFHSLQAYKENLLLWPMCGNGLQAETAVPGVAISLP